MSDKTFHRLRSSERPGVTVRESGDEIRLSVGSSQRMRCSTTAAWALLAVLAHTLGASVTGLPEWAQNAEIEVRDR